MIDAPLTVKHIICPKCREAYDPEVEHECPKRDPDDSLGIEDPLDKNLDLDQFADDPRHGQAAELNRKRYRP